MRNKFLWLILFSLLQIIAFSNVIPLSADAPKDKKPTAPAPAAPVNKIYLINVDAPITPVVSEYIIKSIDTASRNSAEAIIIQLDTPGGLVDSMREIVKKMLSADIPVVVYVAPAGARAASAGVFITIAANIAAMAPTTHIGAAHPVTMEGKMDKTMEAKVVNDLVGHGPEHRGETGKERKMG